MRYATFLVALLLPTAGLAAQTPSGAPTPTGAYTIRPGDILKVDVWGHPEFSGQFLVDETGRLQYPVVGDLEVRNLTITALRERMQKGLGQIFNTVFLTVTPLFRMAVLGQVRNPGLYTVDPTLSVLDVVAMAGGPGPGGNLNHVRLLRGGAELRLSFDQARSLQDMGVRSGDQIVVPKKSFTREDVSVLLSVVQIGLSVAILVKTLQQ